MKKNKSIIQNLRELKVINLLMFILRIIPLTCVVATLIIMFNAIAIIVSDNVGYPSTTKQINWFIIWVIASFKIAFALERST